MHSPKYLFPGWITKADGTPLPWDEPVFLLRAQDELAIVALKAYLEAGQKGFGDLSIFPAWADAIQEHIEAFKDWQLKKLPD